MASGCARPTDARALRARWLGPARADRRLLAATDLDAVLALIDLRLAFMPAIAAAKRATGREVDDPAEARVLEAGTRGRPGDGRRALPCADLDASRTIQRRFLAQPWPVEPLDLDRAARPAVAGISVLVQRAADLARDTQGRADLQPGPVANALDPQTPMRAAPGDRAEPPSVFWVPDAGSKSP